MIIGMSSLGLVFDKANFNQDLTFASSSTSLDWLDQYTLLEGKQLENYPGWNELQLQFRKVVSLDFHIVVRLLNDGLAFR